MYEVVIMDKGFFIYMVILFIVYNYEFILMILFGFEWFLFIGFVNIELSNGFVFYMLFVEFVYLIYFYF